MIYLMNILGIIMKMEKCIQNNICNFFKNVPRTFYNICKFYTTIERFERHLSQKERFLTIKEILVKPNLTTSKK